MGVVMGDSGIVNGANTVRQWELEYSEDDRPYAATNTSAGTARDCGVLDWTGKYFAYGGTPLVFPGDDFSFIGEAVTTDGASGTAIVEAVKIVWEQEKGDYCQHIVLFGGNGDLTLGAIADQSDASIPNVYCGSGLIIKQNGSTVTDVRRAELTIMRKHGKPPGQMGNRPYASTAAPGKIRRKKSRLDFEGSFDCYVSNYAGVQASFPLQSSHIFQMYVNATQYWELTWGRITKLENIGADPEGSELLGVRVHFKMRASNGTSLGSVKSPGDTTEWPD